MVPVGQTLPHAPQLAFSLLRLRHAPPQLRSRAAQQSPASHCWPAAQARPQAPQWAALDIGSTSQPLLGSRSQSA